MEGAIKSRKQHKSTIFPLLVEENGRKMQILRKKWRKHLVEEKKVPTFASQSGNNDTLAAARM